MFYKCFISVCFIGALSVFYKCAITVLIRYKCFISVLKSVCFISVL